MAPPRCQRGGGNCKVLTSLLGGEEARENGRIIQGSSIRMPEPRGFGKRKELRTRTRFGRGRNARQRRGESVVAPGADNPCSEQAAAGRLGKVCNKRYFICNTLGMHHAMRRTARLRSTFQTCGVLLEEWINATPRCKEHVGQYGAIFGCLDILAVRDQTQSSRLRRNEL